MAGAIFLGHHEDNSWGNFDKNRREVAKIGNLYKLAHCQDDFKRELLRYVCLLHIVRSSLVAISAILTFLI